MPTPTPTPTPLLHYEILLPQGLKLHVKVDADPVDLDIFIAEEKKVNFHYEPGPSRRASITPDPGLHTDDPGRGSGDRMISISQSPAASPAISYRMSNGSHPMVP